ncbi:hypothetical protein ACLEX4_15605 [Pseudescherichia vulneris]
MKISKLSKLLVICIAFSSLTGRAWADWQVKTEVDAFAGPETVKLIGSFDGDAGVMYECKADKFVVHYLEKNTFADFVQDGATVGEMAIKVNNDNPTIFKDVHLYRHNRNFISIRSYEKEKIIESLRALKTAKMSVVAGIQMKSGTRLSRRGDFSNASKAVGEFSRKCGITL